jgi:hypothetical protein
MSGASEAVAALRAAAVDAYRAAFDAGARFAHAHTKVRDETDVVGSMARTIDLIVAAEALHDAADAAVRSLRAALSNVMSETGASAIQSTHHAAHLARKPAFVAIADATAIPRDYYVQPPPALDKRAVLSALKDGIEVPGCSLGIPNEQSLVIRTRKQEAA